MSRAKRGWGDAKGSSPGECGEHQRRKKLYRCILQMSYYWPSMKKDATKFVKKCHSCQVQANLIHTHPKNHGPSACEGSIWWD